MQFIDLVTQQKRIREKIETNITNVSAYGVEATPGIRHRLSKENGDCRPNENRAAIFPLDKRQISSMDAKKNATNEFKPRTRWFDVKV